LSLGFLLGTRDYRSEVGEFPLGATLTITVEPLLADGRLGAFRCVIAEDAVLATAVLATAVLATAVVNVYRPGPDELAAACRPPGTA
jgi:predicted hotdog family 3-hydroxylacyl-ACP dehydratase